MTARHGKGLVGRTAAASGWRFGTVAVQLVLQLSVLSVLSRLLSPEDFGVLGVAMIFVNLATVVSDLGAGSALIQRQELTERHVRVTLSLSLAIGLSLSAILGLGAPWWASLFQMERATPILRMLSVSFLLNASGLAPGSLLWRAMKVKLFGVAEVAGYVAGYGLTGICLASLGFGVWSLAWAVVVQSTVRTVLLFRFARLAPVPGLWRQELRDVLGFGLGVSLTRLFNFAATKGDYVVVGRWLGGAALGLYERAYRLMEMPATYFAGVVERVLFSALSEVQSDRDRLRGGFQAALVAVVLVYAPAAVGLWVVAPHLIRALFGEDWAGAILPLRIFSVGLVCRGAHKICDAVIRAKGAVYRSAWRVLFYAVAVLIGAGLGMRWGIPGVAAGVTAALALRYAMVADLAVGLLEMSWGAFLRCHLGGLFLAVGLAGVLLPVDWMLARAGMGSWSSLLVLVGTAALALVALAMVIPQHWIRAEQRRLIAGIARPVPRIGHRLAVWIEGGEKSR